MLTNVVALRPRNPTQPSRTLHPSIAVVLIKQNFNPAKPPLSSTFANNSHADLSGLKCDGDRLSVPKARRLANLTELLAGRRISRLITVRRAIYRQNLRPEVRFDPESLYEFGPCRNYPYTILPLPIMTDLCFVRCKSDTPFLCYDVLLFSPITPRKWARVECARAIHAT